MVFIDVYIWDEVVMKIYEIDQWNNIIYLYIRWPIVNTSFKFHKICLIFKIETQIFDLKPLRFL